MAIIPGEFIVTTDGGWHWNRQVTASFSNANSFPDCIHFFNENEGWCMGDPILKMERWNLKFIQQPMVASTGLRFLPETNPTRLPRNMLY